MDGTGPSVAPLDARALGRAALAYAVLGLAFWRAIADYVAHDILIGGATYRVGDWLVNYAGGFVRRGLFGELLFTTGPPGPSILLALAGFQLTCYAVVACYAIGFLHRTRYSWPAVALVCSPAALPFIGWDVGGGWRKEIIGFAAIALLGWARRASAGWLRRGLVVTAVAVFGLAMFSWEASIFAIPAMLFLLRRPDGRPELRGGATWSILGLGVVGGMASLVFRGDAAVANAICRTVIARGLNADLCAGAIDRIGQPLTVALDAVAIRFPLYWWFLALLPLALLPVLTSRWLRRHWPWFLATVVLVLPLYVVAEDYGRWAHLLAMAPGLAIMAGETREVASRFWRGRTAVPYLVLWGLPHWLFPEGPWPWLGFVPALLGGSP